MSDLNEIILTADEFLEAIVKWRTLPKASVREILITTWALKPNKMTMFNGDEYILVPPKTWEVWLTELLSEMKGGPGPGMLEGVPVIYSEEYARPLIQAWFDEHPKIPKFA